MKFRIMDTRTTYDRLLATPDAATREAIHRRELAGPLARHMGFPPAGVPDYAGYALGYRAVREVLRRSGKSAAEATFVPAQEILEQSRFFDRA